MRNILKITSFVPCKIVKRLNRFVVNVKVKDKVIKAYLNNTGRLEQFLVKDKEAYLLPLGITLHQVSNSLRSVCGSLRSPRKTKFRLSFVKEDKRSASIIDTNLQMKCFEIAVKKNLISWLKGGKILKRNVKLNNSLIDYLIEYKDKKYYLEVKSAVMKENIFAMYPDCPSLRGQKHIKDLLTKPKNSIILFIAGIKNIKAFKPNKNADEKIYELLKIAKKQGIKIKAVQMYLDLKSKSIVLENDDLRVDF